VIGPLALSLALFAGPVLDGAVAESADSRAALPRSDAGSEEHAPPAGGDREGEHGAPAHGGSEADGIVMETKTYFDLLAAPLGLDEHALHEIHLWMPSIMSLVAILAFVGLVAAFTRRLERIPGRGQALVEFAVEALEKFCEDTIGHGGKAFLPFVGTVFVYIWFMNLLGLVPGLHAPTARLETTASLAVTVFLLTQVVGIRRHGLAYFKHFIGEPAWLGPLMFPIHVVGEFVRPVSLSLRLFGNIFGEDTLIAVIIGLGAAMFIPYQLPLLLLSILMGFIQALIFSILTCIYIRFALAEGH
jgi:F-type H+-transporting ATPase subunit a